MRKRCEYKDLHGVSKPTMSLINLLVVDGSNLVTCGRQQATATIQALAYREAHYAIQAAKHGN